ncbi:MAG: hypothetical protein HN783_09565 [Ilumatobacter sp.]|jgi:hypothetical protein|uniref:hypothetical protein n=1 Tax=Ilumatobacter sp. TaxID=1967498 RepID=UPI002A2E0718|nr:hypothetical protein [Ilumatobacter sp.]MDG0976965.1 hypothetical protein [Ilumatobacter sp.]
MNKSIRTGLISTALVAGSLIGAGVVSAQVDDTVPVDPAIEQPADAPADGERGARSERRAERAQATADLLGIDVDELRAAFEDGQTLAQIAEANGVDVQTIIDAKVSAKTERINAAVEEGRLTEAEAAEKLADVEERVTTRVNEGRPERGERGERGDRPARGERPAPAAEQGA